MTDFNASDRDVNRAIRSWLREDRHEDASRIAGAVLDHVEATPHRRATWWPARRTPAMNKIVGFGLAAAAVVAVVLIGSQLFGSTTNVGGPGLEPSPTPEASVAEPTPDPTPTPVGLLPEGPHMILDGGEPDDPADRIPPLTVTIPAPGWEGDEGGGILLKEWGQADGAGMIIFVRPEYQVFGDPCNWATTMPDTPVTTVDEFVAALSSQPARNASEPVDITLGGYTGKSITLHIPDEADFSQCDEGTFGSWNCGEAADPTPCGFVGGPGETSTEYILDVEGLIMAWHTGYGNETPADVVAELEAIVQSASFGE